MPAFNALEEAISYQPTPLSITQIYDEKDLPPRDRTSIEGLYKVNIHITINPRAVHPNLNDRKSLICHEWIRLELASWTRFSGFQRSLENQCRDKARLHVDKHYQDIEQPCLFETKIKTSVRFSNLASFTIETKEQYDKLLPQMRAEAGWYLTFGLHLEPVIPEQKPRVESQVTCVAAAGSKARIQPKPVNHLTKPVSTEIEQNSPSAKLCRRTSADSGYKSDSEKAGKDMKGVVEGDKEQVKDKLAYLTDMPRIREIDSKFH